MKSILFALSLSIFGTTLLQAQETWTLEKCIKMAVENSLAIQETDLLLMDNEISLQQAKNNRLPNLSGNGNLGWNFGRTIDPTTNEFNSKTFFSNNFSLSSGVLLYGAGSLKNNIKLADINSKASQADKDQAMRDISLQIGLFYLNAVFSEENLSLANNQLQNTSEQMERLEKLIRAGSVPANDRLELEVQQLQNEQNKLIAQNSYEINMLQLKQLMRVDVSKEIKLARPSNMDVTTDPDLISFEELYAAALKTQPSITASNYRVESSQLNIDLAKAQGRPQLFAQGSVQTNYSNQGLTVDRLDPIIEESEVFINNQSVTIGIPALDPILVKNGYGNQINENLSYGFGLNLSVPIFDRMLTKNNVERAKLGVKNAELGMDRIKDNLKITVQQSLVDARAAKRKTMASEKSVVARKAAFDNASKRYDIGAISSFEWTSIKTQYEAAQITALIDKYDYLFKIGVLNFYLGNPIKF